MPSYRFAKRLATSLALAASAAPASLAPVAAGEAGAPDASGAYHSSISPAGLAAILAAEDGAIRIREGADASLAGEVDGAYYAVYFYDCDGAGFAAPAAPGSACLGFEYRANYEGLPSDDELVNAFNASHHYGALWRDDVGDLALQLNVIVEGGVTTDNIRATFAWWREVLRSFDEFMEER